MTNNEIVKDIITGQQEENEQLEQQIGQVDFSCSKCKWKDGELCKTCGIREFYWREKQ